MHAFRVAEANNQWTEQSEEPYIRQDQIRELLEKIHEQQGIDPKNLLPTNLTNAWMKKNWKN